MSKVKDQSHRSNVKACILRYHPERDKKPYFQHFELEINKDTTVLDALNIIKEQKDPTLSFRWSCRMAICGSCGMIVNGKTVLTCQMRISHLPKGPVVVEPLKNFPIIKDLVVDIDDPMEKMRGVMPYIERMQEKALEEGEYVQTPKQLELFKQTSQCIKCMLCYSACPVYGLDKKFIGPAATALALRYQNDSRDQSQKKRLDKLTGTNGVWGCSFVGECSAACPKNVDPALALQKMKIAGLLNL